MDANDGEVNAVMGGESTAAAVASRHAIDATDVVMVGCV